MSQNNGIPTEHISRWHLVEQSPSVFDAPTFCILVNQATPHKDIRLTTILNDLLLNMPSWSSSATRLAQAFSSPTKGREFSRTSSCCICQHISSDVCPFPHFRYPNIIMFQVITSRDGILLNTLHASSMLHILHTCQPN